MICRWSLLTRRWQSHSTTTSAAHLLPSSYDQRRQLERLSDHYLAYTRPANHVNVADFRAKYSALQEDVQLETVTLTGRVACIRSSSANLHFIDLVQNGDKVQLILNQAATTTSISTLIGQLQKGDLIEASGCPGRSRTGELSCKLQHLQILTPCLVNLPDDKIGIRDPDLRSRKRHLDLIANPASLAIFKMRAHIVSAVRRFLEERGFLEMETPILSSLSGGAIARPFTTRPSAAGERALHLRIAPELYLKRLLIGGLDRVFELGKQFRDEGVDATHNPEFTTCEFYAAYASLDETARLVEELLLHVATVAGVPQWTVPFRRINLVEELMRRTGAVIDPADPASFLQPALLRLLPAEQRHASPAKTFDRLVGLLIEPECGDPTFLCGHPVFTSPLAREDPARPGCAARFELFVGGCELANGYAELNDPREQRRRFQDQSALREAGDCEIPPADEEFVEALEAGMPPATGCGIGIDRLVLFLTGQRHLRNVLLFPL